MPAASAGRTGTCIVSVVLPAPQAQALRSRAVAADRSLSAELRRLVRASLEAEARPTGEPEADQSGKVIAT
jgi:plasmid stability protein